MKKSLFLLIACLILILGCKKHTQPIKWEKPGDELVGEWEWSKGTIYYSKDYIWEKTDLGSFKTMPNLKMVGIAVFKIDNTYQMITEIPRRSDTLKGKWNVIGDTLKVISNTDGRVTIFQYKVKGDKFIIDNLKSPKTVEEYTRD